MTGTERESVGGQGPVALTGIANPEALPKLQGRAAGRTVSEEADLEKQIPKPPTATPAGTEIGERKAEPVEPKKTEGMQKPAESALDPKKAQELKTKQKALFKKADDLAGNLDGDSLLGQAIQALQHPDGGHKDIKITVTLEGSAEPITLIPLDKKLAKLAKKGKLPEDVRNLMKSAEQALSSYRKKEYGDFNPKEASRELEELKDNIRSIAIELKENDKEEGRNVWERRWQGIVNRPVTVEVKVKDGKGGLEEVSLEQKKEQEQLEQEKLKEQELKDRLLAEEIEQQELEQTETEETESSVDDLDEPDQEEEV